MTLGDRLEMTLCCHIHDFPTNPTNILQIPQHHPANFPVFPITQRCQILESDWSLVTYTKHNSNGRASFKYIGNILEYREHFTKSKCNNTWLKIGCYFFLYYYY